MENSGNSKRTLESLRGQRFDLAGKTYRVTEVSGMWGRHILRTDRRTWVWHEGDRQMDVFLASLTNVRQAVEKDAVAPAAVPVHVMNKNIRVLTLKNGIMNAENAIIVQTSSKNAAKISSSLMAMFDKLSANPTEADFKQAEAMGKMVQTIVSVEQVQINLMKLKNGK